MFSDKYNPDVDKIYLNSLNTRKKSKFQLKNEPYKLIIEKTKNKIKTPEDLIVKTNEKKDIFEKEYEKIINDRQFEKSNNIKLNKEKLDEIRNKFKLKNTQLLGEIEDIPDDYEDLKDNFDSQFKEQENEIKQDRNNFNKMLESLLEDGLLD